MIKKEIFYGWWIVLATHIICMIGFGTWLYSFGVFFKPMMEEFGWTRAMTAGAASLRSTQGGIVGSIGLLTLVNVVGRLMFGYLGYFFDKRFLFASSYVLMGTGIFVLLYAKTMPMVYLSILIFGVGFGGNVPLMPAIQAEWRDKIPLDITPHYGIGFINHLQTF